jgi:hypothetical protein
LFAFGVAGTVLRLTLPGEQLALGLAEFVHYGLLGVIAI